MHPFAKLKPSSLASGTVSILGDSLTSKLSDYVRTLIQVWTSSPIIVTENYTTQMEENI